jgi:hypothetical protein
VLAAIEAADPKLFEHWLVTADVFDAHRRKPADAD